MSAATPWPASMSAAERSEGVREEARSLGFDLVGVVRPEPSGHTAFYRGWLERGLHGEMAYLARPDAVARRADLRGTMPEVRAVVVVGMGYLSGTGGEEGTPPSGGVIARYARGRDYHRVMKPRLLALLGRVSARAGVPVLGRPYVDTGPLLERELARRAGLGWFGRNTMLIHPRRGSWFFLGALLLDLELEPDAPFTADRCGTCTRCLEACPTGALLGRDADGAPVMDARRCISYLTIEHRGPIPVELRPAIGNRIFGCDICQEVCPWNHDRRGPPTPGPDLLPRTSPGLPGTEGPSLVTLLRMSPEQWDLWTRGSALRRAGYAGFRRNVAVAMGNWLADLPEPPAEAVAALEAALDDPEPLVREHARWALDRARSRGAVSPSRSGGAP